MLREIGLATVILIVVTAVVVVLALNQTAIVNYSASGVTGDVALSWGQNAETGGEMSNGEGAQPEATEEATPEATAEATAEATEAASS